MNLTQGFKRAVQLAPHQLATLDGPRSRTWAQCADRVARLAGALQGLGVGAGDRVAVLGDNSDRYIEAYYAIPWAGGVIVPVNTRWAEAEIVACMDDCGPKVLLYGGEHSALAGEILSKSTSIKAALAWDEEVLPEWVGDYEDALAAATPIPDVVRASGDLAAIFYTGGTTGRAKGVMLSHGNLYSHGMNMMANTMYPPRSRYLHAAPLFHLADVGGLIGATMAGGSHIVIPRFEAGAVLKAIDEYRVREIYLVSTMLRALLDHDDIDSFELTSLRTLVYGAAPMPEALLRRALERLPYVRFMHRYGMTETTSYVSLLPPERHVLEGPLAGKLRSAGQPIAGVEVKVVDEEDEEVQRGTIGEVIVRAPTVMLGYWNQPELTAHTLRGGWMHTGDAAFMDEEGYLTIADRIKDMIVSGGENIYSGEVENALYQHAGVSQCAVIGIPDEKWGEAVHAIIVPKDVAQDGKSLGEDELLEHCRALIAGYKCPKSFTFRTESLPISGTGKVLKFELRAPFWEKTGQ